MNNIPKDLFDSATLKNDITPSLYVTILEMMIAKNNIFFVVMNSSGEIVFQNIPNGKDVKALDDLENILKKKNIEKIHTAMGLGIEDNFEITIQDGILGFVLFTNQKFKGLFFLQIKVLSDLEMGESNEGSVRTEDTNGAQAEEEILSMQEVQSLLLELRQLETTDQNEANIQRIKNYFIPELIAQQAHVKDPLTNLCLDIIRQNLDELADSSGTMSKLYKVLTPSEIKVADFIRMGKSSKDIANTLDITQKTVENHRNNLREKLGLKNKNVNLQVFLMNQTSEQDSQ